MLADTYLYVIYTKNTPHIIDAKAVNEYKAMGDVVYKYYLGDR